MSKKTPAQRARRRAKRQAEAAVERAASDKLRAAGHSCATCRHSSKPFGLGKMACDLDSDFQGYATVLPTNVCSRFEARA